MERIRSILIAAIKNWKRTVQEIADELQLALLRDAGMRGARTGRIAREEMLHGMHPKRRKDRDA